MRTPLTSLVALAASLVVGGVAGAAPAVAAGPEQCLSKRVCLYDGANWSGSMKTVGCSPGTKALGRNWERRVTSVINRCSRGVTLVAVRSTSSTPGARVTPLPPPPLLVPVPLPAPAPAPVVAVPPSVVVTGRTTVRAGQWAKLGGNRRMDNAATEVVVR